MGKAVGIGGVFLEAKDPKALLAWYHAHLGVPVSEYGFANFEGPEAQGVTALSFFSDKTVEVGSTVEQSMINFRVDSLDEVLAQLSAAGVKVDPKREDYGFGKFGWFWDLEGNRVELWEPAEEEVEPESSSS